MSEPDSNLRPNPDALLERIQVDEQKQSRGRLKVFFGMCPGVGKTFAMLEAARARKAKGRGVLVGVVETHGRRDTEALMDGLEVLPRKKAEHRGVTLTEFDLDAALARKPELILIDELAHSNAPGSKHAKRWQDAVALLESGIDVFTTINVQHLESLNDVVAKITGVIVRETVPDSVLEEADEIELIDLPPDDLLQRMKDGKVYVSEQAGRAGENFFKKGNLIALRELALRRTAERVHEQVQDYRHRQAVTVSWPTSERLLVCIGPSPFSQRLIRAARRMAAACAARGSRSLSKLPRSPRCPKARCASCAKTCAWPNNSAPKPPRSERRPSLRASSRSRARTTRPRSSSENHCAPVGENASSAPSSMT